MKKFIALIVMLAFSVLLPFSVMADEEAVDAVLFTANAAQLVVDGADILTDSEEQELNAKLLALQEKYGMDYAVVTTDSIGTKSIVAYADDYYDENGYSRDGGILLLVNMDTDFGGANREFYFTTCGRGITTFTDHGINRLCDDIESDMSDGDYIGAFLTFVSDADWMSKSAQNGKPFDVGSTEGFEWGKAIIVALFVGLIAALIITSSMKKKHKSVARKGNAADYVVPGSLNLTANSDIYLYRTVTHVPIPKNEGRGGSSTHMSSGGVSHGGGGRGF